MEHWNGATAMRRDRSESGESAVVHVQLGGSGYGARQQATSHREAGGEPVRLRGGFPIRGHSEHAAKLVFQVLSGEAEEIPGVFGTIDRENHDRSESVSGLQVVRAEEPPLVAGCDGGE